MSINNNYIVLIGKPGSGKGTLAKYIKENENYNHFVMGDVFRGHIAKETELGVEIKEILESGKLVDDNIAARIFEDYINSLPNGSNVIIDGYPRSAFQLESLVNVLSTPPRVIIMDVADSVCLDRIRNRALVENRIEDADDAVINRRLNIFHENFIEIASTMGKYVGGEIEVINLDASKDPDAVYSEYLDVCCVNVN